MPSRPGCVFTQAARRLQLNQLLKYIWLQTWHTVFRIKVSYDHFSSDAVATKFDM